MTNSHLPLNLLYNFVDYELLRRVEEHLIAQGYQEGWQQAGTYSSCTCGELTWGVSIYELEIFEDPAKPVKAKLDSWLKQSG